MSHTARTAEQRAASKDVYPTPPWAVDLILPIIPSYFSPAELQRGLRVLEPAAGAGAIVGQLMGAEWCRACDMIEVREEERGSLESMARWPVWSRPSMRGVTNADHILPRVFIGDALDGRAIPPQLFDAEIDVVLTNPPYNAPRKGIGFEFVQRAMRWLKPHGIACMLLPCSFLESEARYEWLSRNEPDVYVLTRRPSFMSTGTRPGGTDSSSYAWFIWQKGLEDHRTAGTVRHLKAPAGGRRG